MGLSRNDIIYLATHMLAFLVAYAVCMATGSHPHWFDWQCFATGLIAAGAANAGASLNPKQTEEPVVMKAEPEVAKEIVKQPA